MKGYGKRVLIVEHDEDERNMMSVMLENEGYNVHIASEEGQAVEEMKRRRFDVVVSSHHMPKINGFQLVLLGRLVWPSTPMILLLGDDMSLPEVIKQGGVYRSIRKPYDFVEVLKLIRNAIQLTREYQFQTSQLSR